MFGIVLSLLPLIGWGASDYISSVLSKKYHPATLNLTFFLVSGLPVIAICMFLGLPEISIETIVGYLIVSILLSTGFMTMVKAFSTGATGVVSPIANAYAIITLVLAILFLGVEVSLTQVIIVLLIVFGIGL